MATGAKGAAHKATSSKPQAVPTVARFRPRRDRALAAAMARKVSAGRGFNDTLFSRNSLTAYLRLNKIFNPRYAAPPRTVNGTHREDILAVTCTEVQYRSADSIVR
jgi:hypothetical protein